MTEETTPAETPEPNVPAAATPKGPAFPGSLEKAIAQYPQMGARGLWELFKEFQSQDYPTFAAEWTRLRFAKKK